MSSTTTALERVLQEQLSLYEGYIELCALDSGFMAKLQIEELERNNKAKTTILLKIQTMDEARKCAVRQLAMAFGLAEDKVRIEDLSRVLNKTEGEKLNQLRTRLRAVIEKAKSVQEKSAHLAQASLAWINGSLASFQGLVGTVPTYGPQGKVNTAPTFAGRHVEKRA